MSDRPGLLWILAGKDLSSGLEQEGAWSQGDFAQGHVFWCQAKVLGLMQTPPATKTTSLTQAHPLQDPDPLHPHVHTRRLQPPKLQM